MNPASELFNSAPKSCHPIFLFWPFALSSTFVTAPMKSIDLGQDIAGLVLITDFVTEEEEKELIHHVNQQQWSGLGVR